MNSLRQGMVTFTAVLLSYSVLASDISAAPSGAAVEKPRQWTIYLAQDKHLDYNWCGSTTEIELRMTALVDYYLDLVERVPAARWNIDGTIWLEVYRRHRGEAGAQRLLQAIKAGRIGYAGNREVFLWGILSTELAVRGCLGTLPIEQAAGAPARTALIMENYGLTGGAAAILAACGFDFLGRGVFTLRAETYHAQRQPCPLFWWQAPGGRRILVRWDLYHETRSWGGYGEAYLLAELAGEKWDANSVRIIPDRNTPEVFKKRKHFIAQTVQRYEAYGTAYPISSILLLGTGWDNWTCTEDYSAFIRKYNAESDGRVRLVDARYEDFFTAAEREIREKKLALPTLKGSFGITWEEWAAHLSGQTRDFREADRLLRLAEARHALAFMAGKPDPAVDAALKEGWRALLDFAEHDFGGTNVVTAALSAGVRADAAARALTIARTFGTGQMENLGPITVRAPRPEKNDFPWRGGRVTFDPQRCAVSSMIDGRGRELVPAHSELALGEFVHVRYQDPQKHKDLLPAARITADPEARTDRLDCTRDDVGVHLLTEGRRWGFGFRTRWLFHEKQPWIDVTYELEDGWTTAPQSVHFCFPMNLKHPVYRYDTPGTVLKAGPVAAGGDDLPGANPALWAAQTFASASSPEGGFIVLTPDAPLVQFGAQWMQPSGIDPAKIPAQITSLPMMNLTRNDKQFVQGGQRRWKFRYRLVFTDGASDDPLAPFLEAQRFGDPPFLQAPGIAPALPGLSGLDISFAGGPVTAFKVAEDGKRLIVRLWNVLDHPVAGSLKLPAGWVGAEACDALERPLAQLEIDAGKVEFIAPAKGLFTIALAKK